MELRAQSRSCRHTLQVTAALAAFLLVILPMGSGAYAQAPATMPDPASLRAIDKPSDDGSAVLILWAKPKNEPNGAQYVVEVAPNEKGLEAGKFETVTVVPSPRTMASSKPQFFGRSKANKSIYCQEITPDELFFKALTPEQLKDMAGKNVITAEELPRALAALAVEDSGKEASELTDKEKAESKWFQGPKMRIKLTELGEKKLITEKQLARAMAAQAVEESNKEETELTAEQKADQKWYQRLAGYVAELDKNDVEAKREEIDRAKHYYRLAMLEPKEPSPEMLQTVAGVLRPLPEPMGPLRAVQNEAGVANIMAMAAGKKTYVTEGGKPAVVSCAAEPNYFKWFKLNNLVFSLVFSAVVLTFISLAKRRPNMFIRRIAGLDAVDEAIGRSTEMNRPVLFVHGLSGVGDVATIAAVNILAQVARKTADYDSRVRVMNNDPIVTAVSQEVVQQAYASAGRPEAYNPDDVPLVASDQFSYVAAVSGIMVREQPGAIFLQGSFYAESLLLSETGASTGAIQVAGTDSYTQLPFFITTCDYTLMGEELYAASAYLSRDPRLLGSLRGQDVGKLFMMVTIVGVALALTATAAIPETSWWHVDLTWLRDFFIAR